MDRRKGAGRAALAAWGMMLAAWTGAPAEAAEAVRRSILADGKPAAELLRAATAASPTVAALRGALESSDVIVVFELTTDPIEDKGDLRLQAVAGGVRYLRVRVRMTLRRWEQIAVLGHELQHACEVAQAPGVRDEPGLAALMRQIGWETYPGRFETRAAENVGIQVRREIAR